MGLTKNVRHHNQTYVWNGRTWYNAKTYSVPHAALAQILDRLLPESDRDAVASDIANEKRLQELREQEAETRRRAEEGASRIRSKSASLFAQALGLKNYKTITETFGAVSPTYSDLLFCSEWHLCRAEIITRDRFQCRDCGIEGRGIGQGCLQVHHLHYVLNYPPWDYPHDTLLTLCPDCHGKRHEFGFVPVYEMVDGRLVVRKLRPCIRCLGAGFFPQWEHIRAGICFRCEGGRFESQPDFVAVPLEKAPPLRVPS